MFDWLPKVSESFAHLTPTQAAAFLLLVLILCITSSVLYRQRLTHANSRHSERVAADMLQATTTAIIETGKRVVEAGKVAAETTKQQRELVREIAAEHERSERLVSALTAAAERLERAKMLSPVGRANEPQLGSRRRSKATGTSENNS